MTDVELWCVTKAPGRTIVCRQREIPMGVGWDGYTALELRVEHNGEIFRTEVHKERVAFHKRVDELRAMLEAEGWVSDELGG